MGFCEGSMSVSEYWRRLMGQYRGKVAWFNNAKGYGFLSREGGADVFVHYSAIKTDGYKSLKEDTPVEFDIEKGSSGKEQAANVTRSQHA
jgi:CspA family cold shock protein